MGTTASNEGKAPEVITIHESITNKGDINQSEGIGKNKIISLLGLDDHDKYFESTDSDISELNEEGRRHNKLNTKEMEGEIIYVNEATFGSNSTLNPNGYSMKNYNPEILEQDELKNAINNSKTDEVKEHKRKSSSKIKSASPCQCGSLHPNNAFPSTQPRHCNAKTCAAWNKFQTERSDKFNIAANESVKSNNTKEESIDTRTTNSSSKRCNEYHQRVESQTENTPKLTCCLRPDVCSRLKQKNSTATRVEEVPRKEGPYISKSAPQQYCKKVQLIDDQPLFVKMKMQDTGTNTFTTKESVDGDGSLPVTSKPSAQSKLDICRKYQQQNNKIYGKAPNSKYSTSYTYDEQTTDTSGSANYTTETYSTTYSSDGAPDDENHSQMCCCRCMHYSTDDDQHNVAVEQMQDISDDADQCGRREYINLAYQTTGEYPNLVNELESTLSQRNRYRVRDVKHQFEMLTNHNRRMQQQSPVVKQNVQDDRNGLFNSARGDEEYFCYSCQKHRNRNDFDSKAKYYEDSVKGISTGNDAEVQSASLKLKSLLKHSPDYIKLIPRPNNEGELYSNVTRTNGHKHSGWQLNPRTGDWEKVEELEMRTAFGRKDDKLKHVSLKQQPNYNPFMCPNCQDH